MAPAEGKNQCQHKDDDSGAHEDVADQWHVDPRYLDFKGKSENSPDDKKQYSCTDTHDNFLISLGSVGFCNGNLLLQPFLASARAFFLGRFWLVPYG